MIIYRECVLSKVNAIYGLFHNCGIYEVCPKNSWTSLVEVLDKHISLKAFAFHEVQNQLNKWSKFHEN